MSETRSGQLTETEVHVRGSYPDIMIALTESRTPKEAIISADIAGLDKHLSSPVSADIHQRMETIESINKQFNEIGTISIRDNKETFAVEAQKRTAEVALLAAKSRDLMVEVDTIHDSHNQIVPGLSAQPLTPETVTAYTRLLNNVASVDKKLELLHKEQTDALDRLDSAIKMGLSLLPETHRNTLIRQLEQSPTARGIY